MKILILILLFFTTAIANAQTINVKNAPYNAVGDCITDDTIAIQSAMNTNKKVYIPSGCYRTTSDLVSSATPIYSAIGASFSTGARLIGDGENQTIIKADYNGDLVKGAIIRFDTSVQSAYSIGASIEDLSITQFSGRTNLNGVQLTATWFANLKSIEVYGLSGSGLIASLRTDIHPTISDYYQGFQVKLSQLFIHNNTGWGIKFDAGQSPGIYTLENSYIIYNAGGGIKSTTGQCRIIANAITANGSNGGNGGLLFDTSEGPSFVADVRQNEFDSNYGYHIWLKRVHDGNFSQNRFLSQTFQSATSWTAQSGTSFMRPGAHVLIGLNSSNEVWNTKFERNYHRTITGPNPTTASVYAYIHYAGSGLNNKIINNDLLYTDGINQNSSGMIKFYGFGTETTIIDP